MRNNLPEGAQPWAKRVNKVLDADKKTISRNEANRRAKNMNISVGGPRFARVDSAVTGLSDAEDRLSDLEGSLAGAVEGIDETLEEAFEYAEGIAEELELEKIKVTQALDDAFEAKGGVAGALEDIQTLDERLTPQLEAAQNAANTAGTEAAQAKQDAQDAVTKADGKSTISYGTTAPVSPKEGDRWYNSANGKAQIWSGTAWRDTAPGEGFVPTLDIGRATAGDLTVGRLTTTGSATFPTAVINTLVGQSAFIDKLVSEKVIIQGKDNKVGTVLIEDGAVTADQINAQSVAAAVGQFLEIETGQIAWNSAVGNNAFISALVGDDAFLTNLLAKRVVVGDGTNLFGDQTYTSPPPGWAQEGLAYQVVGNGATQGGNIGVPFAVTPGAQVRVSGTRTNVRGAGGAVGLHMDSSLDGGATWTPTIGYPLPAGQWAQVYTVGPGTTHWKFRLEAEGSVTSEQTVKISNLVFNRLTGAVLIEDGAITADKIQANALNGKVITGSTIQTTATANMGIKIDTANGLRGWDSAGNLGVQISPSIKNGVAVRNPTGQMVPLSDAVFGIGILTIPNFSQSPATTGDGANQWSQWRVRGTGEAFSLNKGRLFLQGGMTFFSTFGNVWVELEIGLIDASGNAVPNGSIILKADSSGRSYSSGACQYGKIVTVPSTGVYRLRAWSRVWATISAAHTADVSFASAFSIPR